MTAKSIDQRVVEMQFDNKQFEQGVGSTLKTLDDLKKGLNMDNALRSFSELDRAGKSVSLSGIAESVDAIASKFTALGIMATTALVNITNAAINAGERIAKALTIDPVKQGLDLYETKINAIQTILTNTASEGTTIEDVTKALEELNNYSNQTIYNFGEMARNIGTFTAAGVDLKTSVVAIKGIANLAAGSGSNAQQASMAMYQLSQALASGTVKLMDWNSVVNAGMGGKLFQNALEKTAKELGHGRNMAVSFRDSLQDGWLTTEVLTKTLEKFANDPALVQAATQVKTFSQLVDVMKESVASGWAISWEKIIGNKDEAAKIFTSINNAFGSVTGAATDARNALLSFWHDNGGRDAVIKAFVNTFQGLSQVIKTISEGFRDIFPAVTGKQLVDLSKTVEALTEKFKMGEETSNNLKNTFKGMFAVLDIARMTFVQVGNAVGSFLGWLAPLGVSFLGLTGNIGSSVVALRDALKEANGITEFAKRIHDVLKPATDAVQYMLKSIIDGLASLGTIDTTGLADFQQKVQTAFAPLIAVGNVFIDAFQAIAPIMAHVFETMGTILDKFADKVTADISNLDFSTLISLLNGVLFMGILSGIKKFIKQLEDVTGSGKSIVSNISAILDGVGKSLEAYQQNLKAKTLMTIATSIAILAAALIALSLIDADKLQMSLETISVLFAEMFAATGMFGKVLSGAQLVGSMKAVLTIQGLAIAILILAKAMDELSGLDWGEVGKGLVVITALAYIVSKSAATMGSSTKQLTVSAIGLIAFATSIKILTDAMKVIGSMSIGELTKGLIGVTALLVELSLFMKATPFEKIGPAKGLALIAFAAALNLFARAAGQFGSMDVPTIVKGLTAIGVILGELTLFMKGTANPSNVISTAIGMTILGAAMLVFGKAISEIGSLPLEVIIKGLGGMGVALLAIAGAMKLMPGNMILTGVGLTTVAIAVNLLALALERMGSMPLGDIVKGLGALGASLLILSVAMGAMSGGLPGAAAMLVMAAAIGLFVPALALLSSIPFTGIVIGLAAIAGAFAIIGVAGLLLAPITPAILALGAAILVVGAGFLAVGGGVLLFATGIALLANNLAIFVKALTDSIATIINTIPQLITLGVDTLNAIAKIISEAAPNIIKSFVILLDALVTAVDMTVPKIVDLFIKLVLDILTKLDDAMPEIVNRGLSIVESLLSGIAQKLPGILKAGADIVVNFLEGVATQLPRIIQAGFDLMISFIDSLAKAIDDNSARMQEAFSNLGAAMIKGLVAGLFGGVSGAVEAIGQIGSDLIDKFKEVLGIHSPSKVFEEAGSQIINGLTNGMNNGKPQVSTTSKNIADEALKGIRETTANVSVSEGQYLVDGVVIGMVSKQPDMYEASKLLAQAVQNGLVEEAPRFTGIGDTTATAFLTGMTDQQIIDNAWASGVKVSTKAWEGAKSTAEQMAAAGTAAGQAYIDGLNEAAKKAAEAADRIYNTAASGGYSKAFQKETEDIKNGSALSLDQLSQLTDDQAKKYWEAGGGAAGTAAVNAGKKSSEGLAKGITAGTDAVKKAAENVTKSLVNTTKTGLGIHSPSKVFMEFGQYSVLGFIKGLGSLSTQLANAVNDTFDASPVVTPVLDLDELQNGMNTMSKMLNTDNSLAIGIANAKNSRGENSENVNGNGTAKTNNMTFNQYNYSPKPLSRIDIYRQTKNQFSTLKGMVNG